MTASPLRVLLVDDDRAIRAALARLLQARLGVDVTSVDATEALRLVRSGERYHVAVIDWEMPDIDGVTLMETFFTLAPSIVCGMWTGSERIDELATHPLAAFVVAKSEQDVVVDAVACCLSHHEELRQSDVRSRGCCDAE